MSLRLREPGVPLSTVALGVWRIPPVRRYVRPMAERAQRQWGSGDHALVIRLRAGDEQTFAALVDGWSSWMLRLAREHVPTPSVAEEVVQETWLAVLEGLDRF